MISLLENTSYIAITMIAFLLVLMIWIFLSHKIKNERLKFRVTFGIVFLFFVFPLLLKIILTKGFLHNIGDQSFIMAYIRKFIEANSFVDPLIKDVPPYYPPLFFYLSGKISRVLNINNIVMAYNIGSLVFFSILIIVLLNHVKTIVDNVQNHIKWLYFVFFVFLFFYFFDFEFLYGKSYENLSFILMIIVISEIDNKKENFSSLKVGILLGIIAMLYFYTLIIFAFAFLIYFYIERRHLKISKIAAVVLISFLVSFPYTFPILKQFFLSLLHNQSSYVCTDISQHDFYPYIPDINTIQGLLTCFSAIGFFWVFKGRYLFIKLQFAVIYSLYLVNLFAIAFYHKDFLITARLWAWGKILFYFVTIIFLKELLVYLHKKFDREYMRKVTWSLLTIFTIMAFSHFFNSNLYRNIEVEARVTKILSDPTPAKIYSKFDKPYPLIISNFMHLSVKSPFFYLLPGNLIYANPFSDLNGRIKYLEKIESLEGYELYKALAASPYGKIDGIVGKEANGKIKFSIYTGMLISVQPPLVFEFALSAFPTEYFTIERAGGYTVIILKT